ncbi:DNA/RNA nuclease SfsA [Ruminococcaceae bacterium OttesenSCG-928-L11]|nr:DNA/RNA nuclease SfsA [Ruminococcaceae bacterium OttesenSCG-928-L11]
MKYANVVEAVFLSRPNRFIAEIELGGEVRRAHVKNTGRCRELLLPGATVYVECHPPGSGRKTDFSLIAVQKGDMLINMDSQAPNKVLEEALAGGLILPHMGKPAVKIRRESTIGNSRLDFRLEYGEGRVCYMEVKGVTLEEDGIARFPDAPTERGVKHIRELCSLREQGTEACVALLIQMKGVREFRPNDATHPAFGEALRDAAARGVSLYAWDSRVTLDAITLDESVPIRL